MSLRLATQFKVQVLGRPVWGEAPWVANGAFSFFGSARADPFSKASFPSVVVPKSTHVVGDCVCPVS